MHKHVNDIDSRDYIVINLETLKMIPDVIWADDKHGVYGIYSRNDKDELIEEVHGKFQTEVKFGNILLLKEIKTVKGIYFSITQEINYKEIKTKEGRKFEPCT